MAQPKEALVAQPTPVKVTINPDYTVSPPNIIIGFNHSVEFTNTAAATCSVSFNPGDEFGPPTQYINSGESLVVSPTEDDVTVVYIVNGQSQTGPYSITVTGCAPLEVDVNSAGGNSIVNGAMPHKGWIRFTYNQTGPNPPAYITVNFNYAIPKVADLFDRAGNPVFSQTMYPGDNTPLMANGGNNVVVRYTFSGTSDPTEGGSGTVKIGH
jgi:hypothetical protein